MRFQIGLLNLRFQVRILLLILLLVLPFLLPLSFSFYRTLQPIQPEIKDVKLRAVVVAQLLERSLPTQEIRGSNSTLGKILSTNCVIEKTKKEKKEKRGWECPTFRKGPKVNDFLDFRGGGLVAECFEAQQNEWS